VEWWLAWDISGRFSPLFTRRSPATRIVPTYRSVVFGHDCSALCSDECTEYSKPNLVCGGFLYSGLNVARNSISGCRGRNKATGVNAVVLYNIGLTIENPVYREIVFLVVSAVTDPVARIWTAASASHSLVTRVIGMSSLDGHTQQRLRHQWAF